MNLPEDFFQNSMMAIIITVVMITIRITLMKIVILRIIVVNSGFKGLIQLGL